MVNTVFNTSVVNTVYHKFILILLPWILRGNLIFFNMAFILSAIAKVYVVTFLWRIAVRTRKCRWWHLNWSTAVTSRRKIQNGFEQKRLQHYIAFCPHSIFLCFVWIQEITAIISLYSINWLVFITETECVYCAVRTGSLYVIKYQQV
jgi:hypothetical protein